MGESECRKKKRAYLEDGEIALYRFKVGRKLFRCGVEGCDSSIFYIPNKRRMNCLRCQKCITMRLKTSSHLA